LGKALLIERQPLFVAPNVGNFSEALLHAEDEEHGAQAPDRNTRIALLQLEQRGPTDRGTLSDDGRRNAPPQAGLAEVATQLAERPVDRKRPSTDLMYHTHNVIYNEPNVL
jgi:hypothetical protein